jgi:GNAT superfamily N-acetyltransferase
MKEVRVNDDTLKADSTSKIRPVEAADVPVLKSLIDQMAEYERLPSTITDHDLLADGFGAQPLFRALIAESDGDASGYALFYPCYSSFLGKAIFLEDLFVVPRVRGRSVGQALLSRVAAIAVRENCFGLLFNVLRWNEKALTFFLNAGAKRLADWEVLTLTGDALRAASD